MMMQRLIEATIEAGRAIMSVREGGTGVSYKSDNSPVTEADRRAENIIAAHLEQHFPHIPLIAEESFCAGHIPSIDAECFFLVDPLDGTREFVNGHDDFTVNIALIRNGVPVAGVVSAPARNTLWTGENGAAMKFAILPSGHTDAGKSIGIRTSPARITALISRSHCNDRTREFLRENAISDFLEAGSSLKFCLIAEGLADIYPRFSPTMMWDTAAGDAVLRAAGGMTLNEDGTDLTYRIKSGGKPDLHNPGFIACGACRPATLRGHV